ncbi:MAG: hypothetical protein ACYS0G_13755 [Planctomycetota bacterium]|jgi:hypothetical protein
MKALLLAQNEAGASSPWFGLDDVFWLTILVVFVVAIVAALVRLLQKDRCLKLLGDFHVTYLAGARRTIWGDLRVSGTGLELVFDVPYRTRRGLAKSTTLIFTDELDRCLAICRTVHGLTDEERRDRERQIRRSFNPGLLRRWARRLRNLINTIRDAFIKALGLAAGQVGRSRALGGAISRQKGQIDEVGATLVGVVGNAYEVLLERHIGRPVILELTGTAGPGHPAVELPGYLVDYSDRFVAVFNVEHEPVEAFGLEVTESLEREGLKVDRHTDRVVVTCQGDDALVVRRMTCGDRTTDLSVVLVPGSSVALTAVPDEPVTLHLERTRQIDIVCPRAKARIRYGSDAPAPGRSGWSGMAPEVEASPRDISASHDDGAQL